jgi:hypothetical protein
MPQNGSSEENTKPGPSYQFGARRHSFVIEEKLAQVLGSVLLAYRRPD